MSTDEQLRALWALVTVLSGWGLLAFVLIGRLMGKGKALEEMVAQHLNRLTAEMAKTLAQRDDDEDEDDEEQEQWNSDDEPKGELPGDEWKRSS